MTELKLLLVFKPISLVSIETVSHDILTRLGSSKLTLHCQQLAKTFTASTTLTTTVTTTSTTFTASTTLTTTVTTTSTYT